MASSKDYNYDYTRSDDLTKNPYQSILGHDKDPLTSVNPVGWVRAYAQNQGKSVEQVLQGLGYGANDDNWVRSQGSNFQNEFLNKIGLYNDQSKINFLQQGIIPASEKLGIASAPTSASQVKPIGGVNIPTINSDLGNISNAVAGASGASSYIETQQKMAEDRQKQIEAQIKALNTTTKPLLDRLLGSKSPGEARVDAQQETGIDPTNYFAEQKQKIAEIDSLTQEYNATKAAMEAQIAATGDKLASNNFINNQVAQIQRNAAPKLNMMSANINSKAATLEALQGNFNTAQDYVNQAVQDATAEFKYNMDVYTTFYEMNKGIIESLDAPYQQAYEAALDMAKSEYEQAQADKRDIGKLLMDNPQAGITMNDTLEQAYAKVGIKPPTSGEIIGSAETGYKNVIRDSNGNIISTTPIIGGNSGGSTVSSDIQTYAQAYLDGEIEITSVPQNQRAGVLAQANKIANEALSTTETTTSTESTAPSSHTIKSGDTFYAIAQKYGLTTQQIMDANPGVNPNTLQIGSTIKLPKQQSTLGKIYDFLFPYDKGYVK